ncbi:fibrillin-2-like [Liolophura sinensis]|uniref:fibrillin-2-like n=1 Tax=Liolophura sinensis TaxID=3198878 RepID=UPI0031595BC6
MRTTYVNSYVTKYKCCENWYPNADGTNCDIPICDQRRGDDAGTCQNGGTCTEPGICMCPFAEGLNQYDCSDVNECEFINGGCSHDCVNTAGSYHCACPDGFALSTDDKSCVPSCFGFIPAGRCLNRGKCIAPDQCQCPHGLIEPDCKDLDECDTDANTCSHNCNNYPGGFYCTCPDGSEPDDGENCQDIDECINENGGCAQVCENTEGSYRCACEDGFAMSNTSTGVGECLPVCYDKPPGLCSNGGTCVEPDECECPPGFQTPQCDDIDECGTSTHDCEQHCVNSLGGFRCTCDEGYALSTDNRSCTPACFDEEPGVCPNHGVCVRPGECRCGAGYAPPQCDDVDECMLDQDDCDQLCVNVNGTFTCDCRDGFQLTDDNKTCIPVCFGETPGNCPNGGSCQAPDECTCLYGYKPPDCQDINECDITAQEQPPCEQVCVNTPGSFLCECEEGFAEDEDGACQALCVAEELPGRCLNGGICVSPGVCECLDGYEGDTCSEATFCKVNNGGCSHECIMVPGGYNCSCPDGYTLTEGTQCEDVDECQGDRKCQQNCTNTPGSYECSCQPGYVQSNKHMCMGSVPVIYAPKSRVRLNRVSITGNVILCGTVVIAVTVPGPGTLGSTASQG